nr:TetR/AcrR family transcriptional regulator [Cohnella lubricantis]
MQKNKFELKREATHAKLIQAGFEVFCQKGYSGASVDNIVSAAGLTKGAFYVHFQTKEQFIYDLLKYRKPSRTDLTSGIYELAKQDMPLEKMIHILMSKVVEHVGNSPEWITVYVDFCNQAKHNEKAMEVFRNYYDDWVGVMQYFIQLLQERERLPAELNALGIAKMFYAYLDGSLLHANLYREPLDASVMTNVFVALLRQPEARPAI